MLLTPSFYGLKVVLKIYNLAALLAKLITLELRVEVSIKSRTTPSYFVNKINPSETDTLGFLILVKEMEIF